MARKYTRDNRGRFASAGGGATARGGRLRTASGNKRKTQTMKAAGAGGAGVMKGKIARDPGAGGKAGKAKPKRDYLSNPDIRAKRDRLGSSDGKYRERTSGGAVKKANTYKTLRSAATVYNVQEQLRNTGRLTTDVVRKGVPFPKALQQVSATSRPGAKRGQLPSLSSTGIKALEAGGHSVAARPRKGEVVVDGGKRYKVSRRRK